MPMPWAGEPMARIVIWYKLEQWTQWNTLIASTEVEAERMIDGLIAKGYQVRRW